MGPTVREADCSRVKGQERRRHYHGAGHGHEVHGTEPHQGYLQDMINAVVTGWLEI